MYPFLVTLSGKQLVVTDSQNCSLIWKHFPSVDKSKSFVIKGFLEMIQVLYCNPSIEHTVKNNH